MKTRIFMPIALAAIVLAFVALFGFSRIAHASSQVIDATTVRPDTQVATNTPYEVPEYNWSDYYGQHVQPSVATINASGVTSSTAQLNGYYSMGTKITIMLVSFEYGTSPNNLNYGTTPLDVNLLVNSGNHARTIGGLANNTRYYYRIVGRHDGKVIYGETKSFTTGTVTSQSGSAAGSTSNTNTNANTSGTNSGASTGSGTTSSGSNTGTASGSTSASSSTANSSGTAVNTFARLSITDNESTIQRGDRVIYEVTYEARQALRDAELTIELPRGMTVVRTSRGSIDKTDSIVTVDIGDLAGGAKRTITIDARMNGSSRDGEDLRTTAELRFETTGGSVRSLSATDITEFVGGSSALGASLFGTGVSLSFFNWLVVAGIIAVIIILARKQFQSA